MKGKKKSSSNGKNRSMAIKHAKARKEAMKVAIAQSLNESAMEYQLGEWTPTISSLDTPNQQERWKKNVLRRDYHTPLEQWGLRMLDRYGVS